MKLKLPLYKVFWIKERFENLKRKFDNVETIQHINLSYDDCLNSNTSIAFQTQILRDFCDNLITTRPSKMIQTQTSSVEGLYTFMDLYKMVSNYTFGFVMHCENMHEHMWDVEIEFEYSDLYKLTMPMIINTMMFGKYIEYHNCFNLQKDGLIFNVIIDKNKKDEVDFICDFFGYKFIKEVKITNIIYLTKNSNFICLEYKFDKIPE